MARGEIRINQKIDNQIEEREFAGQSEKPGMFTTAAQRGGGRPYVVALQIGGGEHTPLSNFRGKLKTNVKI